MDFQEYFQTNLFVATLITGRIQCGWYGGKVAFGELRTSEVARCIRGLQIGGLDAWVRKCACRKS